MKKHALSFSLIFLLIILFPKSTNAQKVVKFKIGPMFGLNSTTITTNIVHDKQLVGSGYMAGIFMRVEWLKFYIQPEGCYNTNGTTLIGKDSINIDYSLILKTTNVDVNLLAGYKLIKIKDSFCMRVFGGLGNQIVQSKLLDYNGQQYTQADLNNNNFKLIGGIGFDVLRLTIDARYDLGVTNLSSVSATHIKSNVVSLVVGVKIP